MTDPKKAVTDQTIERLEQAAQEPQRSSPTAGMNIVQRILHVGGRNNAAGYVEFGSIDAVNALVCHVLRDLPLKREWQGLTDEEAFAAFGFHLWPETFLANAAQELKDTHEEAKKEVLSRVRAIEAKLKEKNNG